MPIIPKFAHYRKFYRESVSQKKKNSKHQTQKVVAAQYRNEFHRKMKIIIDSCCGKDIYPLIPQKVLDDTYLCRTSNFKCKAATGNKISSKIIKDAKSFLVELIRSQQFIVPPNDLEISLGDYFTIVSTIVTLQTKLKHYQFDRVEEVREALKIIVDDTATKDRANVILYNLFRTFAVEQSDLRNQLYWYKHDFVFPEHFPAEIESRIEISSVAPKSITVEIDGKSRPAMRLGWAFPFSGPVWVSLKPSLESIVSDFFNNPFDVYIQSHALNRLIERIDCFWIGLVQFNMYVSFLNAVITRDSNNNILVEYRFFGIKAGYFRLDIIDGVFVVRTFLFVTNSGTPEGQLLEKNTGLQKQDKKYLTIDKLSSFMNSDVDENQDVQQIFKKSGCQCLLDLYEKMKPLVTKHTQTFNSELLLKYLQRYDVGNTEGL